MPYRIALDSGGKFSETAPMPPKSRITAVLAVSFLARALAVCLAQAPQTGNIDYLVRADLTGSRGGNLVAAIDADPATFNRMFAGGVANAMVTEPLSADLVHVNRASYELEPALAKGWEAAKDGRTYTIHLRRGLCFSDGSPFTADDVVFTFDALMDPDPQAASFLADQIKVDEKFPSVAKVDEYTVRFAWPRPVGTELRALDSIPMLPRARLLKAYQTHALASAWGPAAAPQVIVGMGPFRLKEYQRGVRIVLERNPYYWKKDKAGQTLPYLDTLTFLVVQDRTAEALRLEAGEIDIIGSMSPEHYTRLRGSARALELTLKDLGPGLGMDFLWFNLNPGTSSSGASFLDPEKRALFEKAGFRQAVSCALNRPGIAQTVLRGLGTPQYGPISSGNKAWYDAGLARAPYDSGQAKALLDQLGLKDGNGDGILEFGAGRRPLELVLLTSRGNAARENSAEIIRQNLAQVGIRLNVQLLPPNELIPRIVGSFNYEAVLLGRTPSDIVPDLQADLWYSSSGNHFWHPNQSKPGTAWEADIDSLTTRMVQSRDPDVRRKACFQVQQIWARQMPAIPTVAPNILSGWRNTVGNVRPSILVPYLLWNVDELTKRTR